MNKKLEAFLIGSCLTASAFATDVTTTPGRLAERLGEVGITDRNLTISGILGPDDFETLRNIEGIDRLDLSDAEITEAQLTTGLVEDGHWPLSRALPAYALFATGFRELILPATLIQIREGALAATLIEKIALPEGITAIGPYAFYGAAKLKSVTLPSTLKTVGASAFDGCTSLTSINPEATLLRTLPERCLARTASLKTINLSDIDRVGAEALYGCGAREISLPSVRAVGAYALAGMPNLEKVDFAPGVTLGEGVMLDCPNLKAVSNSPSNIPDLYTAECISFSPGDAVKGAVRVGDFAFADTATDSFVLLPGIQEIGRGAFSGCDRLYEIDATSLAGFTPDVDQTAFRGIDTSSVHLKVAEGCETIWQTHPVWGQFLIYSGNLNGTEIFNADDRDFLLRADSRGLYVRSSIPGLTLDVHTLDGRLIARASTPLQELQMPLEQLPVGTLVCTALQDNGRSRTIKIIH